jgi:hypothetical protein
MDMTKLFSTQSGKSQKAYLPALVISLEHGPTCIRKNALQQLKMRQVGQTTGVRTQESSE